MSPEPRAKLDLIDRLTKTFSETPNERSKILGFTKKVKDALERRNEVIHGQYGHNKNDETIVRTYSGSSKLTGGPKRLTIEEICNLGTELLDLSEESHVIQNALSNLALAHERRSLGG
jgi:hypothetical protein